MTTSLLTSSELLHTVLIYLTVNAIFRLTSSNYDDDEKKLTGGRNGFGAKLTNIYSLEFSKCCMLSSIYCATAGAYSRIVF